MVNEIKPQFEHRTWKNFALSAENQFLTALQFCATGSFQELIGDHHGIHKPMLSRILFCVSSVLATSLPKYMQFPTEAEELNKQFYSMAAFSGVVGWVV